MRAPAPLRLLLLAACLCGCGCLRSKAPGPAEGQGLQLARATTSEARVARVASLKRWVYLVVRVAAEHGKELGPMLFGSGPGSFMATLGQEDNDEQGCSQADGDFASSFVTEKAEKWLGTMFDLVEPFIMNITDPAVEIGATMQIAKLLGKDVIKEFKQIKHEIPKSCSNVGAILTSGWPQFITCAHQITNISKPCIRCGSRFFEGWTSACQNKCTSSMLDMAGRIGLEMVPVAEEMGAAAASGQMTPEQEKSVMQKLAKVEVKVAKSMKILAPCMKCSRHKVNSMFTCLSLDETFTEDVDSAIKWIEDTLNSGNLTIDID